MSVRDASLQHALGTISVDTFFADYYGQRFLYIDGAPGRFADLVTWSNLDELISCRLPPSRVVMYHNDTNVHEREFVRYRSRRGHPPIPHLVPSAINRLLTAGA